MELDNNALEKETDKIIKTIDFLSGNKFLNITKDDLQNKSQEEILDMYTETALFHYKTELLAKKHYEKVTEKLFNNLLSDKECELFKTGFRYGMCLQYEDV